MDKRKAIFRAKIEERKKNQVKRINHPLVRYNDNDLPFCMACNLVLKSDSHWDAHRVSTKHNQAVNNLKAAKEAQAKNVKPNYETKMDEPKADIRNSVHSLDTSSKSSSILEQRPSCTLPTDYFENSQEAKRQKTGKNSAIATSISSHAKMGSQKSITAAAAPPEISEIGIVDTVSTSSTRALPAGFFDNKDADLRARGIEPVKPNVNDALKEFEKEIQEDLVEVDNRLEEEEIDAAEVIEIEESFEQRAYREKVERLKELKMKLETAKSTTNKKTPATARKDSIEEDSSSDSDDDQDDSTLDWRAQHV